MLEAGDQQLDKMDTVVEILLPYAQGGLSSSLHQEGLVAEGVSEDDIALFNFDQLNSSFVASLGLGDVSLLSHLNAQFLTSGNRSIDKVLIVGGLLGVQEDEAAQADRVVVMHKGSVAADGAPEEVFSQVELLHRIGLAAPDSVELCWQLKQEGFDLPLDKLTPKECAQVLCEFLKA